MFATFGKDAVRARRMGRAMASLTGGEGYEPSHFVAACDLGELNARGGTFVDVGGSHGFVCVELAKKWPNMRFVVQDLAKTVESAPRPVDEDAQVAERVEFKAHDFFEKQDVVGDGESCLLFSFICVAYITQSSCFCQPLGLAYLMAFANLITHSLLLPLDHAQLLNTLRNLHPPEPHPRPEARCSRHHQRSLPPRCRPGECLG